MSINNCIGQLTLPAGWPTRGSGTLRVACSRCCHCCCHFCSWASEIFFLFHALSKCFGHKLEFSFWQFPSSFVMQFHECVSQATKNKRHALERGRGLDISTALATLSAFVAVRQTQANGLTHFWLKWHSQYLFKPCGAGRAGGRGRRRGSSC